MHTHLQLSRRIWMYCSGYLTALILTVAAFWLANEHVVSGHAEFPHEVLIPLLLGLAVVQLFVQLFFFLHIGQESKPRLNLYALLFAVMVVIIIVGGSLWIMNNLNYHMMTPSETQLYMHNHEGL